jgi:hypothetical protein
MPAAPMHRLPAPLEAAVQRIKLAVRACAERTVESLGLAALAAANAFQRDALLGAQFELNRRAAMFVLTFNEAFDERVLRECAVGGSRAGATPGPAADPFAPRPGAGSRAPADPFAPPTAGATAAGAAPWEAFSLVEDREVELQVAGERLGLEIGGGCEWELRELVGYVAPLLAAHGAAMERNPLRPEVIGQAVMRAVDVVSDRPEVRDVLRAELARSLADTLPATYGGIVASLRDAGVQPAGLSVRQTESRVAAGTPGGADSELQALRRNDPRATDTAAPAGGAGRAGFAASTRSGGWSGGGRGAGTPLGQVPAGLMGVMRRLAASAPIDDAAWAASAADAAGWAGEEGAAPAAGPNLIRAHRDELREAASGALDHLVIDLIGALFDQILSDPKVPPQMARQIARLQLPVLRAALGDPRFFSSRRHPVRRFVNRIASLGAAFEDPADPAAQALYAKVRVLVQEVVEGDFDRVEPYEQQLAALEAFVAEQARAPAGAGGAAEATELLAAKEDELRLRALYAQQLQGELKRLAAPEFVREFVAGVWSQVLAEAGARAQAAPAEAALAERAMRFKRTGRDLFMSVQPKATRAEREALLAELPALMRSLTEGLDLIRFPADRRRAFFDQLMPAHGEALKATTGLRTLDFNLLARQVDAALDKALPTREALAAVPTTIAPSAMAQAAGLVEPIAPPRFSAEEAARVGLLEEAAVDWNGRLDLDLSAPGSEPPPAALDIDLAGLAQQAAARANAAAAPGSAPIVAPGLVPGAGSAPEAPEPVSGAGLAEHLQLGTAYELNVEGTWQKVRLTHVSAGRSFFVFTLGGRHKKTISTTQRMVQRLCESGRLRAIETASLIERATARARRQLASIVGAPARSNAA